jgi:glutamine synthetase adenylyltransferase
VSGKAHPAGESPTLDRLREIGVRGTARSLSLLSEMLPRLPNDPAGREAVFRAAAAAADPDLFFLNLSRWADSLPDGHLQEAFRRAELLPLIGALLGGSEFLPEQVARRPEIFEALFLQGGVLARPSTGALESEAVEAANHCSGR